MMFELSTALNNEVSLQSTHAFILKKFAPILNHTQTMAPSPLDVEYQLDYLKIDLRWKF